MSPRCRTFALAAATLCPAALALSGPLAAQMHHVDAPEKVTRAIGVYEWTGELTKPTAARFVPVSLFIEGHFEDAGLYLARPVPFALQSGDLYTVERAGEPEGTFDLDLAERVVSGNALRDDNPTGAWYGFGKYTATAPPKAPPALHRSAHVGTIQSSSGSTATGEAATGEAKGDAKAEGGDSRPHMNRRTPAAESGTPEQTGSAGGSDSKDGGAEGGNSGASNSRGTYNSGGDDTDRPTLARRDPAQDANRRRANGGKGGTASVTAVGPAPGEDPDRPVLSKNSAGAEGPKQLTGLPADLHQAVAVSDAANRDPHPFARAWEDAADRSATMASMEALARPLIEAYLKENRLVPSRDVAATAGPDVAGNSEGVAANTESGAGAPPKLQRGRPTEYEGTAGASTEASSAASAKAKSPPKTARTTRGTTKVPAPAAAPLLLRDAQIAGFTLSYGGLPTFVYSASAPAVMREPGDAPAGRANPTVLVTVVAQRLPSGQLQVSLSSLTDSAHLDRSPRLRLIDAVDPDASHRASLLFEMRGASSRQFALYRLTSARAENTFTSASIE